MLWVPSLWGPWPCGEQGSESCPLALSTSPTSRCQQCGQRELLSDSLKWSDQRPLIRSDASCFSSRKVAQPLLARDFGSVIEFPESQSLHSLSGDLITFTKAHNAERFPPTCEPIFPFSRLEFSAHGLLCNFTWDNIFAVGSNISLSSSVLRWIAGQISCILFLIPLKQSRVWGLPRLP